MENVVLLIHICLDLLPEVLSLQLVNVILIFLNCVQMRKEHLFEIIESQAFIIFTVKIILPEKSLDLLTAIGLSFPYKNTV